MTQSDRKKLKVLYLITKSNWGGAQRYVYDLATNLPSKHYDVVVALGGSGALHTKLTDAGIRTISIPSLQRDISLKKELRSFLEIAALIRSERPDVLHVNSSKAGGIGAFVGRVLRVSRIIYTAHGWAFNEDRPWWQKWIVALFHWLTIRFTHKTIVVSRAMKTQMRWPFVQKKMVVINPGRDAKELLSRKEARKELVRMTNTPNADGLWIGTIAELHPIKRLRHAIDAVAQLKKSFPTLTYIIIGDGELRDTLQTYVEEHGLRETIHLTGAITNAAEILPAFDIFLLTSKSESYGYVLLEAGHASLPVVATNTGGIPDIITDKESGLLVPIEDVDAIEGALARLLKDEGERRAKGAALQKTAQSRTVQTMVTETCIVYTEK